MASCENKYTTLLDLSRQAKVITVKPLVSMVR